jgi:hypothetical protein
LSARARRDWLPAAGAALALAAGAACSSIGGDSVAYGLPSRDQYVNGGVSAFMERRCGALDCHGQEGRPLRLYSSLGLRLGTLDGGGRDTSTTSNAERIENYHATVGLEPEQMSQCVESYGDCSLLMLMLKPLDIEGGGVRHKGGPVLRNSPNDPGWMCLQTWVQGNVDPAQCQAAVDLR